MDLVEPRPVVLLQQSFKAASVPESADNVSEEARLRAAITWSYEYDLYQHAESYSFSSAVYFNHALSDLEHWENERQFEVVEQVNDSERTLLTRATRETFSIEQIEIIPLDSIGQPLEYRIVNESPIERTIRYLSDLPPASLRINFNGLNILQTDAARACVHSAGMPPVCFAGPLVPMIERTSRDSEDIRIDKLSYQADGQRDLQEHLQVLFDNLFDKEQIYTISLRFDYSHQRKETGMIVVIPVTKTSPMVYTPDVVAWSAATLKRWYQSTLPPAGTFIMALKVHKEAMNQPVLHLARLLLPVESIADL